MKRELSDEYCAGYSSIDQSRNPSYTIPWDTFEGRSDDYIAGIDQACKDWSRDNDLSQRNPSSYSTAEQ